MPDVLAVKATRSSDDNMSKFFFFFTARELESVEAVPPVVGLGEIPRRGLHGRVGSEGSVIACYHGSLVYPDIAYCY